jgi:hypothetical protein
MRNCDAPLFLGPWSQLVVTLMKIKGGASTSLNAFSNRVVVTASGHISGREGKELALLGSTSEFHELGKSR